MRKSYKLAFCSIISSLSSVTMILTGVIPAGTYALPAISGILLLPIIMEFGTKPTFYAYVVTSLLAIVLAADKEAVILFILFFGYYPIVQSKLSKVNCKSVRFIIKLLIFNIAIILSYLITVKLLLIPEDSLVIAGIPLPYALLIFSNIIFLVYDYSINLIAVTYILKIRPIMHIPR